MSAVLKLDGARVLKRNPPGATKLDGAVGIELGKVLEFEVRGQVIRTGRSRSKLIWFPVWKALIFFEGVRTGPSSAANLSKLEGVGRQEGAFERWAQREARKSHPVTFPAGARKWYAMGKVDRLDYWSDKWGKDDEYTHDFGNSVKLYALFGKKSAMWVIRGGKLRVTRRGIEG